MVEDLSIADTQPVATRRVVTRDHLPYGVQPKPSGRRFACCGCLLTLGVLLILIPATFLFISPRTNILLLGIDRTPPGTAVGRSDTMILVTVQPLRPYVGLLSIPRDLWVDIPGVGENRINAAHLFAENSQAGAGPASAVETVEVNFGIDIHHYIRIQFDGLEAFVDAIGGVPIRLENPTVILSAGDHLLDGTTALAFVRDRKGSDDFFRMQRGQLFVKATLRRLMDPRVWLRLPSALVKLAGAVDTDIPPWTWPRIGLGIVLVGAEGIDARVIDREMVQGFTTSSGAQVLAPDWPKINPVLLEMFGQ